MKKRTVALSMLLAMIFMFISCEKETPTSQKQALQKKLEAKYPGVTNAQWAKRGNYNVATFVQNGTETKAWFSNNENWQMTETEIAYNSLPKAVINGFKKTQYGTWEVDDVAKLERAGLETVYVIEVENDELEADLYFSANGVLLKTVLDNDAADHENLLPPTEGVANKVKAFVSEKYPNANIVDIDTDDNEVEVEIIDGNKKREITFNTQYEWMYTETEIATTELPTTVKDAIKASTTYANLPIDEVSLYETPKGSYYMVEFDTDNDLTIKIDDNGTITNITDKDDDEKDTSSISEAIKKFINQKYPNATPVDVERKKGYLVIEVMHENIEKDIYFDKNEKWIFTKWDIPTNTLPQPIFDTIKTTYKGYSIDEAEMVENSTESWYIVELEKGDYEISIRIKADGTVIK